jgi:hypothetical protein
MTYKPLFLAITILFMATTASAQLVPGFQGKRLFVEGNFSCLPLLVLSGPTLENAGVVRFSHGTTALPTTFPISWRGGAFLHYVTGRKGSIFAGVEYFQTGLITTAFTRSVLPYEPSDLKDIDRHSLFMAMTAQIAEIGKEWNTGRGMLSPMGAYFRLNLQYYMLEGKILDKYTRYGFDGNSTIGNRAIGLDNAKTWDAGVGLEFGSRSLIAKNTTFTMGLRFNVPVMWAFGKRTAIPLESDNYTSQTGSEPTVYDRALSGDAEAQTLNYEIFEQLARTRNSVHSIVMLNLGIGYLIK